MRLFKCIVVALCAAALMPVLPIGYQTAAAAGGVDQLPRTSDWRNLLIGRAGGSGTYALGLRDDQVFVAVFDRLLAFNITDRKHPSLVGSMVLDSADLRRVVIRGNTAYLAAGQSGLVLIDIGNPSALAELARTADPARPGDATCVDVAGNTAYVVDAGRLRIYDVTNPRVPTALGAMSIEAGDGYGFDIHVVSGFDYVAYGGGGLRIVDVREPRLPRAVAAIDRNAGLDAPVQGVAVRDGVAYLAAGYGGVEIVDVSSPAQPLRVRTVDLGGMRARVYARRIALAAGTAAVATGESGLLLLDLMEPTAPRVVASLDTPTDAWDVALTDSLAVIADTDTGAYLVDVADMSRPRQVGSIDFPGPMTSIAVRNSTAFATSGVGRLQAYDVGDRGAPKLLGTISIPGSAWKLAISGNTAAVLSWPDGLCVVDVSDPQAMAVKSVVPTRLVSQTITARAVVVAGSTAYVVGGDEVDPGEKPLSGLIAYDVGNPTRVQQLGALQLESVAVGLAVVGSRGYIVTSDAGLYIIDVSNPANPTVLSRLGNLVRQAHSVAAVGGTSILVGGDGTIHRVDVADPISPTIVGSVETDPSLSSTALTTSGKTAYVGASTDLFVLDLHGSNSPKLLAVHRGVGFSLEEIAASNDLVAVAGGNRGLLLFPPRLSAGEATPTAATLLPLVLSR